MSRLTGSEAKSLKEAYNAIYTSKEEVVEENEQLNEGGPGPRAGTTPSVPQRPFMGQLTAGGGRAAIDKLTAKGIDSRKAHAMVVAQGEKNLRATPSAAKTPPAPAPGGGAASSRYNIKNLGAAQYAAFKGGGGLAAMERKGQTAAQVIAQGRKNIGRFDGGPRVGTAPTAPAARSAATTPKAAPPLVRTKDGSAAGKPVVTPATTPATTGFALAQKGIDLSKPSATPAAAPKLTKTQQDIKDLQNMRKASQQRIMAQGGTPATPLVQSFDLFDVIKGHLLDEGYADTEEAAIAIMANMGEEWRQSIVDEGFKEIDREKHGRMYNRYKKLRTAAMNDARETGEASGENRRKMGKMGDVIDKSAENLRNKG